MREYATDSFRDDFTIIVTKEVAEGEKEKIPVRIHKRILTIQDIETGRLVVFSKGKIHYKDSRNTKKPKNAYQVLTECVRMLGVEQGENVFYKTFGYEAYCEAKGVSV